MAAVIDWRHVNADSIGHHVIRPLRRDLAAIIGDHPRLGDALDLMHELTLDLFLVPPVHIAEQLRAQGIDATVQFAGDELKDKARDLAAPAILVRMHDLEEPLRRHVAEATGPLFAAIADGGDAATLIMDALHAAFVAGANAYRIEVAARLIETAHLNVDVSPVE